MILRFISKMDSLPNEIIDKILQRLTFTECVKLASTCKRFHDVIPRMASRYNLETLHLRDEKDIPSTYFLSRYGSFVGKIRLNVHLCKRPHIEKLKAVFDIMPHRIVEMESVELKSDDSHKLDDSSDSSEIREFFSAISVREIHRDDFEKEWGEDEIQFQLPKGVEKCTVRWSSLRDIHQSMPLGSRSSGALVKSITSLSLIISQDGGELESIWKLMDHMPRLTELSLVAYEPHHENLDLFGRGSYGAHLNDKIIPRSVRPGIKKLSLAVYPCNMAALISKFPGVESLRVDVSKFNNHLTESAIPTLPVGLKELHLHGELPYCCGIGFDFLDPATSSCRCFFDTVTNCPNLEVITADFSKEHAMRLDMAKLFCPTSNEQLMARLRPEVIRDLYWDLICPDGAEWNGLVSALNVVPALNNLFIAFDSHQIQVAVASPKITTKISQLHIQDEIGQAESFIEVLSSFLHVAEYSLSCNQLSQTICAAETWASEHNRSASWTLRFRFPEKVLVDPLRGFPNITRLEMGVWHEDAVIDMNEFHQVVGSNIKHFEFYFNPEYKKVRLLPRLTPAQLATCLSFPKLESLHIWNLDFRFREDFVREIEGWKTSKIWPESLREIRLSFRKFFPCELFSQFFMVLGDTTYDVGPNEAYKKELAKTWHTVVEKFGDDFKMRHQGEASDPNSSPNWKGFYEDEARHCGPSRSGPLKSVF